jgi:hypothetical protein
MVAECQNTKRFFLKTKNPAPAGFFVLLISNGLLCNIFNLQARKLKSLPHCFPDPKQSSWVPVFLKIYRSAGLNND